MSGVIEKIEACGFECEAGPLTMSRDWLELKAIVERLPVTADGVPITPGMELWSPNIDGAAHAVLRAHYRDGYSVEAFGWGMNVQPEKECYSTRAVADAAADHARKERA